MRAPAGSETDLVMSGRLTRIYKINPNAFREAGNTPPPGAIVESRNIQKLVLEYFGGAGIDLSGNSGASRLFFNERTGTLTVEGTIPQLEAMEKAVKVLTERPLHVAIDMRVMQATSEVGNSRLKLLLPGLVGNDFILPSALLFESDETSIRFRTAVLTAGEFMEILKAGEQSEGIDTLTAPRTVTINGRTARIVVDQPKDAIFDPLMRGGAKLRLNAE